MISAINFQMIQQKIPYIIYIYTYMCVHKHIYMYVHIWREKEKANLANVNNEHRLAVYKCSLYYTITFSEGLKIIKRKY